MLYTIPLSAPEPPPGLLDLVQAQAGPQERNGLESAGALAGQVYYQVLLLLVGVPPLPPGPGDRPVGAGGGQGPALAARGDGGGDAAEHDHLRHLALLPLSDQRTVKLMAYQVGQGCILF